MMTVPLSRHLTRFSSVASAGLISLGASSVEDLAPERSGAQTMLSEPSVTLAAADLEARLESAGRKARSETTTVFEAKIGLIECNHRSAVEAAVVAAREEWAAKEADHLRTRLDHGFDALRSVLSDRVAAVLRPLLAKATVDRALVAFAETLDQLLADPAKSVIAIRGPADLVAALRDGRDTPARVSFEISDDAELSMIADEAHVESRLAAAFAVLSAEAP